MRKNSVGSRNAKTGKVTIARVAKLSGYSTANVILKRKQGLTDEEIVTQGLARQERRVKEREEKEGKKYQAGTKVFDPTTNSTANPAPDPNPVDPTRLRELRELRESEQRPPLPPPPSMSAGESLDPIDIPAETYSQAALREKIAMANKREMEELVMRGILVQAEEVAQVWARIGGQIRDELLAIPDRISIRLDQRPYREIREILMGEVRRVLMGISEDAGKRAESDTDNEDPVLDSIHTPSSLADSTAHQPNQSL